MIVHLGRGVSVPGESILILTDLQGKAAQGAEEAVRALRSQGLLRTLGPSPKTLVMCYDRHGAGKRVVGYLSCVGLRTLRLRMEESDGLAARSVPKGRKPTLQPTEEHSFKADQP